ncbi:hypothetical protein GL4_2416 [Methyloceanibacter caenitepidi]|uniref:Uncharacterized protein n=1 Tax=Methyloceanibacter caenitepidi TaxID=1384459 RepID=A0A0A8K5R4_9HYPH|nr:hypothetical protein GL4_2416 [Methyloceanibacter caenitepidi]
MGAPGKLDASQVCAAQGPVDNADERMLGTTSIQSISATMTAHAIFLQGGGCPRPSADLAVWPQALRGTLGPTGINGPTIRGMA